MRPLARDLGIDRRTVERWATGRWQPPRDIWVLILAALNRQHNAETEKLAGRSGAVARQLDLNPTSGAAVVVATVV
jgi:hypothetical protein